MQVTSVSVRKIEKEGSRMRGIASIVLDDSFAVHDIRIIEGDNGLFIAMPSRKTATGGYRDIAHPINPEVRSMFEDAILEAYNNAEEITEEEVRRYKSLINQVIRNIQKEFPSLKIPCDKKIVYFLKKNNNNVKDTVNYFEGSKTNSV